MNEQPQPPVWLITGCSGGLGRALATHVLARGHRLVATSRKPTQLDDLVARHPETCRALALDVTEPSQVKAAIAQAVAAFGRIDVVVNNAGYGLVGALEELSDEQIARNLDANFSARWKSSARRCRSCARSTRSCARSTAATS